MADGLERRVRGGLRPTPDLRGSRQDLARTFVDRMEVETETLVDDISNTAMACYAAWPERIYVIDQAGRIAYKGGMGPFRFEPEELREFLTKMTEG